MEIPFCPNWTGSLSIVSGNFFSLRIVLKLCNLQKEVFSDLFSLTHLVHTYSETTRYSVSTASACFQCKAPTWSVANLVQYGFVEGSGTNYIRMLLVPILLPTNSPCSSPKYRCFFWVASDQIQFCDSSLHPTTFCTKPILQCSFTIKTISYCAQNFVKQPSQFANNPS